MKFEDRAAIVTGGARGIGKAIALSFVREGAKVTLVDVDKGKLEVLKNEIEKEKGKVIAIPCDITKSSDVKEMVDQVHKKIGRIDILVNNAGIIRRGTIETVTEEDWDQVIAVNLKGTFNCCKAVAGIMKKQGYGKIINVSSIAGKMGDITSAPGYGPSKAGIDALTKTLARQLAPYGINVNVILPGSINIPVMNEDGGMYADGRYQSIMSHIPMQRPGTPEDIGYGALYLASDAASYVTGSVLVIDGGWTCGFARDW